MSIFHRHNWTPIAVQHGEYAIFCGLATQVLRRCDCGKTDVDTINGLWTLEQLSRGQT